MSAISLPVVSVLVIDVTRTVDEGHEVIGSLLQFRKAGVEVAKLVADCGDFGVRLGTDSYEGVELALDALEFLLVSILTLLELGLSLTHCGLSTFTDSVGGDPSFPGLITGGLGGWCSWCRTYGCGGAACRRGWR